MNEARKQRMLWERRTKAKESKPNYIVVKGQSTFNDFNLNLNGAFEMNIKELAKQQPKAVTTPVKNVADLPYFPVDATVYDFTGTDKQGSSYSYKYIELN
ncbi:MAG: hypothetical protein R3321_02980, partial [Nitrososphaeraceae archaeon]|nr:hypothetical protein [Nitrososphaeraceae archaeon]